MHIKLKPWYAKDLVNDDSWIMHLSEEELEGLAQSLAHAKTVNKDLLELSKEDFPFSQSFLNKLDAAFKNTQENYGLTLLKGFPVDSWTEKEAKLVYWGMGLHTGVGRTQNIASDIMSDVRDAGNKNYKTKNGRGYNTNLGLDFHVDFCDVVSLLCRRTAKEGGTSLVTSSIALVEEIKTQYPHLFPVLQEPFYYSLQGANAPDEPAYYKCPLFDVKDGVFAFRTNRKNITAAQRDFPEIPRLTEQQTELLDVLDKLLPDPRFCYSMNLDKGDLQLVNNYIVVHSRTDFTDFEDEDQKRHLIRLWMTLPYSQALPDSWAEAFKDTRAGAVRGGNRGSGITEAFLSYERNQANSMNMHNIYS